MGSKRTIKGRLVCGYCSEPNKIIYEYFDEKEMAYIGICKKCGGLLKLMGKIVKKYGFKN